MAPYTYWHFAFILPVGEWEIVLQTISTIALIVKTVFDQALVDQTSHPNLKLVRLETVRVLPLSDSSLWLSL